MMRQGRLNIFSLILFCFTAGSLSAQIVGPGAVGSDVTSYPTFPETDNIFIFCVENESSQVGELQATTELSGTKTFLWEKYDSQSGAFDLVISEGSESNTSSLSGLSDGCYRVTISQGATTEIYRAWIFNTWIQAEGAVSYPDCESFALSGSFISSEIMYYDLSTNAEIVLSRDMRIQWKNQDVILSTILNTRSYDPITTSTNLTLRVYDRFGCEINETVPYEPVATKAKFSVDFGEQKPDELEAPLTVNFINESENGDPNGYEWFFYRNLDDIKEEAENSLGEIDSIMLVAYDENPIYTYENTGTYLVKLVSNHYVSEILTCTDTFTIEDYIIIEPSFVEAPNVFTPGGSPGVNDEFIVKFWSMKSVKISIFNRWGKRVHYWSKNDIRGFENTYMESVWDGKIGGRYASPGVYYYVVEGQGRDGEPRRKNGFVHLFRGRN